MPLDDLTWRLGSSGTILNGDPVAVGDSFVDIDRAKGFDQAPIRMSEHDHEGMDGGFVDAEFEKSRPVSLEGTLYATTDTIIGILDGLKAEWCPSTSTKSLYVKWPNLGERKLNVKTVGVFFDIDTAYRLGITPIMFQAIAEDPRFYDTDAVTENILLGTLVFTGFGFNLGFPFGFGSTTAVGDGKTITNSGNRDAPAVLRINGPSVNPTIINDATSSQLDFNITIASGEYLEIDLGTKTVRLNGTANRRSALLQPNWFLLEQGDNFIRYQAETGSAGSSLDVTYSSAWR